MPDAITALMAPDDEAALREARGLADQIRGQSDLGMLYQMSGHGTLAPAGRAMQADAQSQRNALAGGIPKILKNALDRDQFTGYKLPKLAVEQMRAEAYRLRQAALNETEPARRSAMLMQAQAALNAAANGQFTQTSDGDVVLNKREGVQTPGIGQHNEPGGAGGPGAATDPAWAKIVDKADYMLNGNRTTLGQVGGILRQVNASKALWDPQNKGQPLTPQQLTELAVAISRVVGGNTVHRKTLEEIAARSFGIEGTRALQFFTGKPEDLSPNAKLWAKHFLTVLQREEGNAKAQINDFLRRYLQGHADTVRRNVHVAKPWAEEEYGLPEGTIDEILAAAPAPQPPARPAPPPGKGSGPAAAPGGGAAPKRKGSFVPDGKGGLIWKDG